MCYVFYVPEGLEFSNQIFWLCGFVSLNTAFINFSCAELQLYFSLNVQAKRSKRSSDFIYSKWA